jgi:hypothetical protein
MVDENIFMTVFLIPPLLVIFIEVFLYEQALNIFIVQCILLDECIFSIVYFVNLVPSALAALVSKINHTASSINNILKKNDMLK